MIEEFELNKIISPLLEWFYKNKRVLPWRENPSPYRVWISEIMLQQTRVEAVKPYFERFMAQVPGIKELSKIPEEKLLKLWEGLGYYNRARNLKEAAIQMMDHYDGNLPDDYNELLKLKGIGHYTAGAIASIAYQIPVPAVDGNVLRVISRLTEDDRDILKQSVKENYEKHLLEIIPLQKAGDFNQALMELGATVCVPNGEPLCNQCPWENLCLAKKHGTWQKLPVKAKAKPRRIEEKTILIIRDGERIVLEKRSAKGLLAGLYEFPNEEGFLTENEVIEMVKKKHLVPIYVKKLEEAKHIFSHVEWHMKGYMVKVSQLELNESKSLFVEIEDAKKNYPIPSAFAKYTKYMNLIVGKEGIEESLKE